MDKLKKSEASDGGPLGKIGRAVDSFWGVLKVARPETPPDVLYALTVEKTGTSPEGIPTVEILLQNYVLLRALSPELQKQIVEFLAKQPKPNYKKILNSVTLAEAHHAGIVL
jgi:hypothetical protein